MFTLLRYANIFSIRTRISIVVVPKTSLPISNFLTSFPLSSTIPDNSCPRILFFGLNNPKMILAGNQNKGGKSDARSQTSPEVTVAA